MKTIGLLGGMSWQSTTHYYQIINEEISSRLGGLHSAKIMLSSVDFADIEVLQRESRWEESGVILGENAKGLRFAGADFVLICANTMHIVADQVEKISGLPVLHIADATAAAVKSKGIRKVGLLGTRYTMEKDFIKNRLSEKHSLRVEIPDSPEREMINQVIFGELCLGIVRKESKEAYLKVMERMAAAGVEGFILGCTEIEMLISPEDFNLPVFPTTRIHALAAVDRALGE